MKVNITAVATLLLLSFVTSTYADQSAPSSRELRLEKRIKALSVELSNYEKALEKERLSRGVSTVDREEEARNAALAKEQQQRDSIAEAETQLAEAYNDYMKRQSPTLSFNPTQIDSLLNEWHTESSQAHLDNYFSQYVNLDIPLVEGKNAVDTLYKERLLKLASPIELPYNSIVKGYINTYSSNKSNQMKIILSRAQYFFPTIEEELIKQGLPVELRAMAVVESALTNTAVSRTGAGGLWQFMPATGKMYGLEINSLVDERCDPVKATVAACKFMRDLYNMYNDWTLALAAYNCGPGNVNKAMARSGLKEGSYWDIYDYLPRETRGYLPAFIGATYAYAYHAEHNIEIIESPLPLATDTIEIKKILHLGQVAEVLDLPIDILRKLNPQYRKDIIPATTKSYSLRLPQQYVSAYITNEEGINALDSTYLKEYINPRNIEKLRSVPHGTIYTVRSGDTLSGIAQRYRTTTRLLMTWNNLRSANKLSVGQKLIVSK